jgi:hypothetical protein
MIVANYTIDGVEYQNIPEDVINHIVYLRAQNCGLESRLRSRSLELDHELVLLRHADLRYQACAEDRDLLCIDLSKTRKELEISQLALKNARRDLAHKTLDLINCQKDLDKVAQHGGCPSYAAYYQAAGKAFREGQEALLKSLGVASYPELVQKIEGSKKLVKSLSDKLLEADRLLIEEIRLHHISKDHIGKLKLKIPRDLGGHPLRRRGDEIAGDEPIG